MQDFRQIQRQNQTRPVKVASLEVQGGADLRAGFLEAQVAPLLATDHTLESLVQAFDSSARRFRELGLAHTVDAKLDLFTKTDASAASAGPNEALLLQSILQLTRVSPWQFWTRTQTQPHRAQVDLAVASGNVFGGAERLVLAASFDTAQHRLRAYNVLLATPIGGSPDWTASVALHSLKRTAHWASHAHVQTGATAQVRASRVAGDDRVQAEVGFQALRRLVHDIQASAGDVVRLYEGDGLKTSMFGRVCYNSDPASLPGLPGSLNFDTLSESDGRYDLHYPSNGLRAAAEVECALGSQTQKNLGDVSFVKTTATAAAARELLPGNSVVLSTALAGGIFSHTPSVNILDRFQLAGAVYGYEPYGIGPRDYGDAVGGTGFFLGTAKLHAKVPWLSPQSPLRALALATAGSLVLLDSTAPLGTNAKALLFDHPPATAVALGLAYKTAAVQFEAVYAVPVHAQGNQNRQGLQFGLALASDWW